jgi:hypothetical protein
MNQTKRMKSEHHQQIRASIGEEIAALRARGATDADMHEEAFIALVGEKSSNTTGTKFMLTRNSQRP